MTSPSEITPAQAAYEAKLAAEGARHGITLTSAWDSDGFAGRDDWAAAAKAAVKAAPVDLTDLAEWVELLRERDEARAELAKAGELIRSLERAAGHKLRELYAAYIEVMHGACNDDAATILVEALDDYDGPQWNGTESGIEWLERTEAPEVTP